MRFLPLVGVILAVVLLSGCIQTQENGDQIDDQNKTDENETDMNQTTGDLPAWMKVELKDVATGNNFKISDFVGKPILLETFAVWCPKCLSQQREIQKLGQRVGDSVIHIALNTDQNEGENKVRQHIERHGFDWLYAVAPRSLTRALQDEFGLTILNAPQTPVVLICEDGSFRLLRNGIKSANDLESEVQKGC